MPSLSCITTCKSRLGHLRQTLPGMMAVGGEVIVVDYDCPQRTADWVLANHPEARVVKVDDRPDFNLAKARNLGAAAASGEWLLFVDADALVGAGFRERVEPLLAKGWFLLPQPRPAVLWGTLIVSRADFERIGGYDEVFEGWGSEDEDIIDRLSAIGTRAGRFPGELLDGIAHGNELRTHHHQIKDALANNAINFLYRQAKRDLARHGAAPTLPDRKRIYAEVRRALTTGEATSFQIGFRKSTLSGRKLVANLRYEIGAGAGRQD
ncbi:MAG TPA: glycosyltransferase family A protein [Caulobacteraceae bacterium]